MRKGSYYSSGVHFMRHANGEKLAEINGEDVNNLAPLEEDNSYLEGVSQVFAVEDGNPEPSRGTQDAHGSTAISFPGSGPEVRPEVAAALRRLHQNLGHRSVSDKAPSSGVLQDKPTGRLE